MRRHRLVTAGAGVAVLLTSSVARSDDPVTSAVRFNREIVRIFDRKCVSCHAPGAISMSLVTYRDVRPWSRAIREELVEQRMPPTSAVPGYSRLKDDIALTPRELATILTWVDGGVPRGDDSDLPAPRARADLPEPDYRLPVPEQQVPGEGQDVIRHTTVEIALSDDRWVRQVQIVPGDRRLLRAAFATILKKDGSRIWAGSWMPWQTEIGVGPGAAFLLPRGARLALEFHYRGLESATVDRSAVALFFAPEGKWRELTGLTLTSGRAVSRGALVKAEATLPGNSALWGGRLEDAAEGTSVEIVARRPDGSIEVLLWVPRLRADWPAPFLFQDPVGLPAGTVISLHTGGPQASRVRALLTLHRTD